MKNSLFLCTFALLLVSASGSILAQDQDYDFHPALSDNFVLGVGAFRSDSAFKISFSGDGASIPPDIDFGDSVGVDKTNILFNAQLRWKFGKKRKWSLSGQYFENDATGNATLTKDVEWGGLIFREGTFVEGGVDIAIARLFLGYSIVKKPQHDFGVGAGIHNLDISAFIGGEIRIDDETTGYQRADAGASQPLPNIGAWYNFSPAKRWLLHGRVDWISANIDVYDGTMWNFNAGVNFQAWRHVGFDLSYQYFNIDIGVDDGDWIGRADMRYSGPVVSMTFNW
jgi:opacity protein-like surface antigen